MPSKLPLLHALPQVTFPEGTIIGLAKSRVPVHVSFSSPRPLAFTSAIDLLDEAGMRYSMPVTAITDNSLATHVAFWEVSSGLPYKLASHTSARVTPCM